MKYLGIDYGSKRIGIATSDDSGTMAFPLRVVENTGIEKVIEALAEIAKKEKVDTIVCGESHDLSRVPNPIMQAITPFAKLLGEATGLSVHFISEVYTSREAAHIQGDNDQNDASAAAIILQSYLDRSHHLAS